MTQPYPKRLIEVDLPIKRISAHARREKSIRHGHISTLHIWWARRPLAACRAVICASLWPDPADPSCPQSFRDAAVKIVQEFAKATQSNRWGAEICDNGSFSRYMRLAHNGGIDPSSLKGQTKLRAFLLDFIADFASWEGSTNEWFLDAARSLTQAAHEALGGEKGTRPLVVDPFAGGGAIPLEALRVGADAFASDLNPVAVLLNKVVLEYIPKYGQKLADEVREWGQWVKEQAEKELARFYPKDADSLTPIAYLWARTIKCEGPHCGAEVPLMRSLWLAQRGSRSVAIRIIPQPNAKRVDFEIIRDAKAKDVGQGTVRRGAATCPCCGYTTPVASVRSQMRARDGGSRDARLFAVVCAHPSEQGRYYRLPTPDDLRAANAAQDELRHRQSGWKGKLSLIPDEPLPPQGTLGFRVQLYGILKWGDLFTPRQLLSLTTLVRWVREAGKKIAATNEPGLGDAVQSILSLILDRMLVRCTSNCIWDSTTLCIMQVFNQGQALPLRWEFAEMVPMSEEGSGWQTCTDYTAKVFESNALVNTTVSVEQSTAVHHPLPDDAASAFITDPPYYDAVPYAALSDFFYVWLKRTLPESAARYFDAQVSPKADECIVDQVNGKDRAYFERTMAVAMAEGRRVLRPEGIGVVVFAHKSTAGWESQLQAMVDAGWTMTGSWPIDTESGNRLRAKNSAALASSVHLVCRPREDADGKVRQDEIGDWRDILV